MKARLRKATAWLAAFVATVAASPMTYVLGFGVAGAGLIVAGVAILAGAGWALVAAGAFLIAAAAFITRGMTNG